MREKHITANIVVAAVIWGVAIMPALAQTTATSSLIADLIVKIQQLQSQILALQQQQGQAVAELVQTLHEGSRGNQVKILQALLAADPMIYPEGSITGYYGRLTSAAVRRFQQKNGLEQVGVVGPKTLKKLNGVLQQNPIALEVSTSTGGTGTTIPTTGAQPCAIVPPGHLIAPGWLRKQGGVAPIVPACQT